MHTMFSQLSDLYMACSYGSNYTKQKKKKIKEKNDSAIVKSSLILMAYFIILLLFSMVWQHDIQKHKAFMVSRCSSAYLCVILDVQDNFHNMALQKTVTIVKHFLLLTASSWHSQSFRSSLHQTFGAFTNSGL